jgi:hypothetical protein
MDPKIRRTIGQIPDHAWVGIRYPQAIWDDDEQRWISDAEVAAVDYTAFASRHKQAVTAELIVRRVPTARHRPAWPDRPRAPAQHPDDPRGPSPKITPNRIGAAAEPSAANTACPHPTETITIQENDHLRFVGGSGLRIRGILPGRVPRR